MRQTFGQWLIKNFVNIFSVFGVFATLYLGFFYVPTYIKESQNERLNNSTKEVVQALKELLYSDSSVTISDINSIIESKKASANIEFPNDTKWFLLNTESSFMDDKFIPLKERQQLVTRIERLIVRLPAPLQQNNKKSETNITTWLFTLISILVTIAGLVIGYISARANFLTKKIKDEEIANELKEAEAEIDATQVPLDAIKIEKSVLEILKELKFEIDQHSIKKNVSDFDFQFLYNTINYFVEVKFLRASNVGLKSIETFILRLREKTGIGIFIYNTELTVMAESRIRDNNKINPRNKIYYLKFTTKEEVLNRIKEIVNLTAANKSIYTSRADTA